MELNDQCMARECLYKFQPAVVLTTKPGYNLLGKPVSGKHGKTIGQLVGGKHAGK